MNVLVIGSGGREHALAWKIKQSPRADRVFVAPGNAGTAIDAENVTLDTGDFAEVINFIRQNDVETTVIGPEAPLVDGLSDALEKDGLRVFGPSRRAAQLEGSKVFCKNLLKAANVPSAEYKTFTSAADAEEYLVERFPKPDQDVPVVIKADGLAAGKGAIVCHNREEAFDAIDKIARRREFGDAGDELVIEERLDGLEASVLAITDGKTILTLPAAQDHKPAGDGDTGLNTGGMGAYSPAPIVDDKAQAFIEEHVLVPTVHQMKMSNCSFKGVLYAGLMFTSQGPKVLEYNVRFGDPECQPLLMRLQSDLMDVIDATIDGTLDKITPPHWDPRPSVCVVMASEGYPGSYDKGHEIRGLAEADAVPDVKVFHAGTKEVDGKVVTSGGRVLGVSALGSSIPAAKLQAYTAVKQIRWTGAWCRKDISDKAFDK